MVQGIKKILRVKGRSAEKQITTFTKDQFNSIQFFISLYVEDIK